MSGSEICADVCTTKSGAVLEPDSDVGVAQGASRPRDQVQDEDASPAPAHSDFVWTLEDYKRENKRLMRCVFVCARALSTVSACHCACVYCRFPTEKSHTRSQPPWCRACL